MGNGLYSFWQDKVKKTWKIAFFSAFILGLLVHMYKFTNNFPYFDSYYNAYSSQNMLSSGRWFLSVACAMTSFFDLPWLNGVACVVLMALTAVAVTEVFDIENPCLIVVSSGLLVSFPAITETMFFEFTADGYMMAMLLSSMAVCFSRMEYCGSLKHFLLSMGCLCLACGTYQAYISFAFILAVCYLLGILLDGRYERRRILNWVFYQAGIFLCALAVYYAVWQILMRWSGTTAHTYQGMDAVGSFGLDSILSAVVNSISSFVFFLLERNPLQHGWTAYSFLSCLTCAVFFLLCGIAFVKSGLVKRKMELFLALLCLASIPFGCYVCYFISPGITYYTRMLQSVVLLFIFTGVLCERWIRTRMKDLVFLLLLAVMTNHSVMANVCYTYLDRSYEQSYAVLSEISTRIHQEDDGTVKYIAFCGTLDPVSEDAEIDNSQLGTLGPLKLISKAKLEYYDHMMLFMRQYLDFTLSYYRVTGEEMPKMEIEDGAPVPQGYEFRFPVLSQDETYSLLAQPEVEEMGIWPAGDSVKKIGSTIVVKLSAQ